MMMVEIPHKAQILTGKLAWLAEGAMWAPLVHNDCKSIGKQ
jgi:hypothetical protein